MADRSITQVDIGFMLVGSDNYYDAILLSSTSDWTKRGYKLRSKAVLEIPGAIADSSIVGVHDIEGGGVVTGIKVEQVDKTGAPCVRLTAIIRDGASLPWSQASIKASLSGNDLRWLFPRSQTTPPLRPSPQTGVALNETLADANKKKVVQAVAANPAATVEGDKPTDSVIQAAQARAEKRGEGEDKIKALGQFISGAQEIAADLADKASAVYDEAKYALRRGWDGLIMEHHIAQGGGEDLLDTVDLEEALMSLPPAYRYSSFSGADMRLSLIHI